MEVRTGARARWSPGRMGAMLGGSLTGFATFTVMILLGTALELTSAAMATDEMAAPLAEAQRERTLGPIVWLALSAIAAGLGAGTVMNHLVPRGAAYQPVIYSIVSWAGGLVLAMVVGISSACTLFAGAGVIAREPPLRAPYFVRTAAWTAPQESGEPCVDPWRDEVDEAVRTAAALAWTMLLLPLLGLSSTFVGAGLRRREPLIERDTSRAGTSPRVSAGVVEHAP